MAITGAVAGMRFFEHDVSLLIRPFYFCFI